MKKYISILTVGLILTGAQLANAQRPQSPHELGVSVKGGALKGYGEMLSPIEAKTTFNTAFGFQYDYYLTHTWSIGIGGQYAIQSLNYRANNISGQGNYVDTENDKLIFSYAADQYKEEWKYKQINIPLTIQYTGEAVTSVYAKTGIQYSAIMNTKGTHSWTNLETKGYFPDYDIYINAPIFAGFGHQSEVNRNTDVELKDRWAWIAEVGVKHSFNNGHRVYFGVYLDLGINNQKVEKQDQKEDILTYRPQLGDALEYNSIQQLSQSVIRDFNVGIQLRYALGL